jgi:hypothetical protein
LAFIDIPKIRLFAEAGKGFRSSVAAVYDRRIKEGRFSNRPGG